MEGRVGLWDRENAIGMRNEEGAHEQEGRIKVGPLTSNGHSDSNAHLGISYPTMYM